MVLTPRAASDWYPAAPGPPRAGPPPPGGPPPRHTLASTSSNLLTPSTAVVSAFDRDVADAPRITALPATSRARVTPIKPNTPTQIVLRRTSSSFSASEGIVHCGR